MAGFSARERADAASVEVQRAVARYTVASAAIVEVSKVLSERALTDVEVGDFDFIQGVVREARTVLKAAGRLDLVGGAS